MLWSFIHSKSLCSTSLSLLHIGRWTMVEKNKWCWVVSSYIMMPSLRWALRCSWHQSYCANRCFPTLQNEYAHFPPNLLHCILQSSLSPQDCVSTLLRNQNQWDRNIFIFAVKWPLRHPASVFIFLAFVLLLWVVSLLLSKADKLSTCAWDSIPLLFKDVIITLIPVPPASLVSPSVLNHPHLHTNIFLYLLTSHSTPPTDSIFLCSYSQHKFLSCLIGIQLLTSLCHPAQIGLCPALLLTLLCCQI